MTEHQSPACCSVPPVVAENYKEKGEYTTVDGMKTYSTGPSSATKGILIVWDIFSFSPQILQGADILSNAADKSSSHNYRVFMPDWFEGVEYSKSDYPPDSDEKKKKLGEFFAGPASAPKAVGRVPKVIQELSQSTGIKEWAMMGYCWGGKVVNLSVTKEDSPIKVAVAVHPAMVDPKDAEGVKVPFLMLPSNGESKDDVKKWEENIKTKQSKVIWFSDSAHGWMAARADLTNPHQRQNYEKGYQTVLDFLKENF